MTIAKTGIKKVFGVISMTLILASLGIPGIFGSFLESLVKFFGHEKRTNYKTK